MVTYDILVVGGGPAGMGAALGAREAGVHSILLVERLDSLGGILNQCIHTGFGLIYFGQELTGVEYAARFTEKIRNSGIDTLTGTTVVHLHADGTGLLSGPGCGLLAVRAKAVILAAGCRERPIGTLPISGTRPSGIFTAGTAQKMINLGGYDIGDQFVILGSGDVGMIMARQLTQMGKRVLAVIEKEKACGGLERNRKLCLEAYHIPLKTRCTVGRIHGTGRITGISVYDLENGREDFLPCDTLITSIGLIPERELWEEASENGAPPNWLFLCGNACFVHDLVDDVTMESEHTGRQAAAFVQGVPGFPGREHNPGEPKREGGRGIFCTACPKACPLTKSRDGYSGALCGRSDPVPSESKAERFADDITP